MGDCQAAAANPLTSDEFGLIVYDLQLEMILSQECLHSTNNKF